MRFTFLHAGIEIDGDSLRERPLGGTETALIGLARALAADPACSVDVFTHTARPGVYDRVRYHPLSALAAWSAQHDTDVLVSIRQWLPFILPVRSRLRMYWSPDAADQPFLHRAVEVQLRHEGEIVQVPVFAPKEFLPNLDAILCVGRWQAESFATELGFPRDKLAVFGNGHFPENFAPLPLVQRHPRLLYSATPFRGLEHLVRYFPRLRERHPGLELEVCSGMAVYGVGAQDDQSEYGALYQALRGAGAISHGSIRQAELHRLMCAARVYAYPNTFAETFCISVLEAQAAGLPVVTSRLGALPERVTDGVDGFLIDGQPGSAAYDTAFMDAVSRLMSDDGLWHAMSEAARAKAAEQTYERMAAHWRTDFAARLARKPGPPAPPMPYLPSMAGFQLARPGRPGAPLRLDAGMVGQILTSALAAYGYGAKIPA